MDQGPEVQSSLEVSLAGSAYQFVFSHPPGTFSLTPASKTLINAIAQNAHLLQGIGIDWGSGVGCLAIVAAKLARVEKVYGLEISEPNVAVSYENAKMNAALAKVDFWHADSYRPYTAKDQDTLSALSRKIGFILANPPSSKGDDGFGFRREVLRGGKALLKEGGLVFLNISFQYGRTRTDHLLREIGGYRYGGLLYSTAWVPFDLKRADLLHCLETYAAEERKEGVPYTFKSAAADISGYIDASTAYQYYRETGKSPLTKWQTHLFELAG